MFHALSSVLCEEGFRALYKGWLPSVIGVVPYMGLNFAVYESLKDWLIKSKAFGLVEDNELGVLRQGLHVGMQKAQSDKLLPTHLMSFVEECRWLDGAMLLLLLLVVGKARSLEYTGMVDAFRKTVRHEGFRALYNGLVPNSLKVVPSIAIAFVTYEQVKEYPSR